MGGLQIQAQLVVKMVLLLLVMAQITPKMVRL